MKGAMAWPFLRLYILTLMFFSANAILNVFIPLRGHDLGATNTVIGIVMGGIHVNSNGISTMGRTNYCSCRSH